jgi:uncharacterized protein (TIGR02996 family)
MSDLREALEQALEANPDDLASHRAWADYLQEQPDPVLAARGELIGVQLQLEDPDVKAQERKALKKREAELLEQHGRPGADQLAQTETDRRVRL